MTVSVVTTSILSVVAIVLTRMIALRDALMRIVQTAIGRPRWKMDKTELRRKMDKLCKEYGESCTGCPCQDLDVCNNAEDDLTDKDYQKGIEAFESNGYVEVGESTADASKVPLHATEEPTQWSDYDVVSKPKHYVSTSIECIDAMRETQGVEATKQFCICNAFKYLWRHNVKNGNEDIKKASWYLNKAVSLMEGETK